MGEAGMAIDLGGTTTEFAYGAGGMALEKQGGTYTQAHTVGNGLLRRGSEYPLFDGHGSERTVTNSSQTVTGSVNFEAFGQVAGSTGSSASPTMYAGDWGYRNDGDAGLMHVGARYYDAQVGRFITRDTVLSEHPYLYCEHDPVNAVDPSGHFVVKVWWLHCWIGYPGGSIGFYPGTENPFWGPGLFMSPDKHDEGWGIPVFGYASATADTALAQLAPPGGIEEGGIYSFPIVTCIQGAAALALYAIAADFEHLFGSGGGWSPSWDLPLGP
jgi:RHS repeat-associated protein